MLRLSWTQPEDLVPHALRAAELDGVDTTELRIQWEIGGGAGTAPVSGATPKEASPAVRLMARRMLVALDELEVPLELVENEPEQIEAILELASAPIVLPQAADGYYNRIHGAWLGRAAGCLLGKPVEKVPREGIREIAESTGNWPIASYFTARGLHPSVAARYPWNRRSRVNSLIENIDGMPEDDDLNFPLLALDMLEREGSQFSTDDVARSWLANLPGGRVFTAERIAYRNLLDGHEPEDAAWIGNPFRDWIGAQIRTDVYGWASPGEPQEAARMAWADGRLSHGRNGLYGGMFAAAACSAAVVADSVSQVIDAALSVIPSTSRYAAAVHRGVELGRSPCTVEEALDALAEDYGHLHWVHALNNSALLAFALVRGEGDFVTTISLAVTGGWDTDSVGATAGSISGALNGARQLPADLVSPLRNRLNSSVPGFDGIGFDELARRTVALVKS